MMQILSPRESGQNIWQLHERHCLFSDSDLPSHHAQKKWKCIHIHTHFSLLSIVFVPIYKNFPQYMTFTTTCGLFGSSLRNPPWFGSSSPLKHLNISRPFPVLLSSTLQILIFPPSHIFKIAWDLVSVREAVAPSFLPLCVSLATICMSLCYRATHQLW